MLRSIAGVVVSATFMVVFGVGLQMILSVSSVALHLTTDPEEMVHMEDFQNNLFMRIAAPTGLVIVGLMGGFMCDKIARSNKALLALAAVMLMWGQVAFYGVLQKQIPAENRDPKMTVLRVLEDSSVPMWIVMFGPYGQALGVLVGGMVLARSEKRWIGIRAGGEKGQAGVEAGSAQTAG